MSNQTSQKYYLINLSTRNVSISTHLRAENFTLGSGKCIYLGNLTDEQIVKYHRYSALNVSLRIFTADKAEHILNKSINATENLKESILGNKTRRVEHEAGSIAETIIGVSDSRKSKMFSNPQIQQKLRQAKIQQIESSILSNNSQNELTEKKAEILPVEEELKKEEPNGGDVIEVNEIKESEIVDQKETAEDKQESSSDVELKIEESNPVEDNAEDNEDVESKHVDGDTVDESLLPKQIDVVEENAKLELEKMSYSDLYDLAKASNITFNKKPSRKKLIDALAAAQV
jgi:hypothetical protein